jgi:HEAT repeat protein
VTRFRLAKRVGAADEASFAGDACENERKKTMGLKKPEANLGGAYDTAGTARQLSLSELLESLDAADAAARRRAARDLAAYPTAVDDLSGRLATEDDDAVRETIFTALIEIGDDAAARALAPLLRSEDPRLRNGAIEALQQLPEQTAPLIVNLLEDSDSDVRIFAVNVVDALRHPQTQEWLRGVIRRETHVNVLGAAVEALAEIGSPDMIADLEALAGRHADQPFLCFAVKTAIRRIRGA